MSQFHIRNIRNTSRDKNIPNETFFLKRIFSDIPGNEKMQPLYFGYPKRNDFSSLLFNFGNGNGNGNEKLFPLSLAGVEAWFGKLNLSSLRLEYLVNVWF